MIKGIKNEPARQRHRQRNREQYGCKSVPASAVASESSSMHVARKELTESNHFGWTICGKFNADPEFERLMQYHEKPHLQGVDDQTSTYVLCLEDKVSAAPVTVPSEDEHPGLSFKATQTSEEEIRKYEKEKKKNLISEFLYIPITERSRSRSPSTGRSKLKTLGKLTDEPRMVINENKKAKNKQKLKNKIDSVKNKLERNNGKHIGIIKNIEQHKKNLKKESEEYVATNKTVSEYRKSVDSVKKLGPPKKIGPAKYATFGGSSNKSMSKNSNPDEYKKMDNPSVTFYLDPVKSKLSSSEHLLRTEDLRSKKRSEKPVLIMQ